MPTPYLSDDTDIDPYAPPDLVAQQEAILRRKARLVEQARLAAQQAGVYKPYQPNNEEVGGFTLSTGQRIAGRILPQSWGSIASAVAPLVAQHRLQGDQAALTREEAQFNARARADRDRRLAAMPTSRPAVPGIAPATPNDDDGNPMPIPREATLAYEPTLRERLEWAAGLRDNPLTSGVGDALTSDILVKEPERVEARAERKAEKEATRAEARRKQQEDIDFKRWQTDQNNQMRADIAMLVHGGRGGGGSRGGGSSPINLTDDDGNPVEGWKRSNVKASEIVKDVASDGTVTLTDKLTGQRLTVGGGGRTSGAHDKDALETRDAIERSQLAISEAPRAKELLNQGSSSGLRADIRKAGAYVAPSFFGGKAMQADKALEVLSDTYLKSVPRFSGPTSDGDRIDYAKAAGALANTNNPPDVRAAALDEVVRLHSKSLAQNQQRAPAPARPPGAPPTVRESVIQANKQHGGGRALTFNPATGKLE